MNASEVETFLHLLGCQKVKRGSSWVNATCPFGMYHRKGRDTVPSFGVSIAPDEESSCRCQACGVHGPLLPLLWQLGTQNYNTEAAFYWLVNHNQWRGVDDDEAPVENSDLKGRATKAPDQYWKRRAATKIEPERKKQSEVPEALIDKMRESMTEDVMEFLTRKRGLNELTIIEWELGWHPNENRVCIPIRDESGKLVSISGRLLVRDYDGTWTDDLPEDSPPKYLHSPFSRNIVLYGMDKAVTNRVGYLFEGFFQAIASYQAGYNNVFGRMGTHLSGFQIDWLVERFDKLVLVPDGDAAGYKSVAKIEAELLNQINPIKEVVIASMPEGFDADQLKQDPLREILGPINC